MEEGHVEVILDMPGSIHNGSAVGRHSSVERTKKVKLARKNVAGFVESPT